MGNSKLPSDDSQARIKGLSYGNVKGTTRIPSRKKKKYVLVLDSSTDLGRFQEKYVFEIQLGFEVIVRCKYPGPTRLRKVTDGNSPLGHSRHIPMYTTTYQRDPNNIATLSSVTVKT